MTNSEKGEWERSGTVPPEKGKERPWRSWRDDVNGHDDQRTKQVYMSWDHQQQQP